MERSFSHRDIIFRELDDRDGEKEIETEREIKRGRGRKKKR